MFADWRLLALAFGSFLAVSSARGQEEPLPPIFAPRPPPEPVPVSRSRAALPVSSGLRSLLHEASTQVLARAQAFETPSTAPPDAGRYRREGDTVFMPTFLVRSAPLRREEVERRLKALLEFEPMEPLGPGAGGGYSMSLLRFLDERGSLDFRFLQAAGRGADHGREINRAELGFRFQW